MKGNLKKLNDEFDLDIKISNNESSEQFPPLQNYSGANGGCSNTGCSSCCSNKCD